MQAAHAAACVKHGTTWSLAIPFHRKPGERVIMEGIHALNPDVVGAAHGMSTKIYISVRTRVQDSAGNFLN